MYDSQNKVLMMNDSCYYFLSLYCIVVKNSLMLVAMQNEKIDST
jgi:hypothetical protein